MLRTLTFAFMGALVMIAVAAVLIAPDVLIPPVWASLGLLAVLLVAIGLSELLLRVARPLPPGASDQQTFAAVQALHLPRMAVLEAPALLGLVALFVLPEPSFVTYLIAAVPTLVAMAVLVVPHRATLERYERSLDRDGARSGLVAWLTGSR